MPCIPLEFDFKLFVLSYLHYQQAISYIHASSSQHDRVMDRSLGYMILQLDGTVQSSHGQLANNEHVANLVSNLVTIAKSIPPHEEKYKKISIVYPEFRYCICLSNARIHIAKVSHVLSHSDTDSVGSIN